MPTRKRRVTFSVAPAGAGRWKLTYNLIPTPESWRPRETEVIRGLKADAVAIGEARCDMLNAPAYVAPSNQTLNQWFDRYLDDLAMRRAPQTVDNYSGLLRRHVRSATSDTGAWPGKLGDLLLDDLKPLYCQDLYAALSAQGLSGRTVVLVHTIVHAALDRAVELEVLGRNVADAAKPPRVDSRKGRALTFQESAALLRGSRGHQDDNMIILDSGTGLRLGELLGLAWPDVSFPEASIRLDRAAVRTPPYGMTLDELKTPAARRTLNVGPEIMDALRDQWVRVQAGRKAAGAAWHSPTYNRVEVDLVFPAPDGGVQTDSNVERRFRRLVRELGFPGLRYRDLRHTHCTQLDQTGTRLKDAQARMGHKDERTTLGVYTHKSVGGDRAAAASLSTAMAEARQVALPAPVARTELEILGARIREAREGRGLSCADVGAIAGCSRSTVSMTERGLTQPRPRTLEAILAAVGLGGKKKGKRAR